jgi:hypothetical protein
MPSVAARSGRGLDTFARMKRFFAIACVFVLGCVAGGVASQFVVPPARAGAGDFQRWEYVCADNPSSQQMSDAGLQGWELATTAGGGAYKTVYCFKRKL